MSRRAVYTGSFDPISLGHLNVIERSARLVDELIVGVGQNVEKQPLFTADERVELIQLATAHITNIVVTTFDGLAVRFVRDSGARVIIRGVRSLGDIEAEFTMTLANRKLDPDVETVFLMAGDEYSHVSSTLIKQIAPLADDEELSRFVPRAIIARLRSKLAE
ncbi:MAG: pantetheine-phosphate adenylyltransferase [Pirellulales bacterium]|nr:pantetheine-phosphate adenylyltransferase [Pirellulales bacterium]